MAPPLPGGGGGWLRLPQRWRLFASLAWNAAYFWALDYSVERVSAFASAAAAPRGGERTASDGQAGPIATRRFGPAAGKALALFWAFPLVRGLFLQAWLRTPRTAAGGSAEMELVMHLGYRLRGRTFLICGGPQEVAAAFGAVRARTSGKAGRPRHTILSCLVEGVDPVRAASTLAAYIGPGGDCHGLPARASAVFPSMGTDDSLTVSLVAGGSIGVKTFAAGDPVYF
jgi:hypothetical protein